MTSYWKPPQTDMIPVTQQQYIQNQNLGPRPVQGSYRGPFRRVALNYISSDRSTNTLSNPPTSTNLLAQSEYKGVTLLMVRLEDYFLLRTNRAEAGHMSKAYKADTAKKFTVRFMQNTKAIYPPAFQTKSTAPPQAPWEPPKTTPSYNTSYQQPTNPAQNLFQTNLYGSQQNKAPNLFQQPTNNIFQPQQAPWAQQQQAPWQQNTQPQNIFQPPSTNNPLFPQTQQPNLFQQPNVFQQQNPFQPQQPINPLFQQPNNIFPQQQQNTQYPNLFQQPNYQTQQLQNPLVYSQTPFPQNPFYPQQNPLSQSQILPQNLYPMNLRPLSQSYIQPIQGFSTLAEYQNYLMMDQVRQHNENVAKMVIDVFEKHTQPNLQQRFEDYNEQIASEIQARMLEKERKHDWDREDRERFQMQQKMQLYAQDLKSQYMRQHNKKPAPRPKSISPDSAITRQPRVSPRPIVQQKMDILIKFKESKKSLVKQYSVASSIINSNDSERQIHQFLAQQIIEYLQQEIIGPSNPLRMNDYRKLSQFDMKNNQRVFKFKQTDGCIFQTLGYKTSPKLDEIVDFNQVKDFKVWNENGSIQWLGISNIRYMNLDDILQINRSDVSMFDLFPMHEYLIPSQGQKLNKECIVTLQLKNLKKYQQTRSIKEVVNFLKCKKNKPGDAEFLEVNETSGVYSFKIFHFSRYCFDDSDAETDQESVTQKVHELENDDDLDDYLRDIQEDIERVNEESESTLWKLCFADQQPESSVPEPEQHITEQEYHKLNQYFEVTVTEFNCQINANRLSYLYSILYYDAWEDQQLIRLFNILFGNYSIDIVRLSQMRLNYQSKIQLTDIEQQPLYKPLQIVALKQWFAEQKKNKNVFNKQAKDSLQNQFSYMFKSNMNYMEVQYSDCQVYNIIDAALMLFLLQQGMVLEKTKLLTYLLDDHRMTFLLSHLLPECKDLVKQKIHTLMNHKEDIALIENVLQALTVQYSKQEVEELRLSTSKQEKYCQLHPNSYLNLLLENKEYTKALEVTQAEGFGQRLRDTIIPAYFSCGINSLMTKIDTIQTYLTQDDPIDNVVNNYLNGTLTFQQVKELPEETHLQEQFKKYMMMSLI